jgi:putative oxidoreductase
MVARYETESAAAPRFFIPALGGIYAGLDALVWPLVRFVTGFWLVPHGAGKLFGLWGSSVAGTAGSFAKIGLEPAYPLAMLVGCTEFFGGLCIALGFLTRPAALAAGIFLATATFFAHWGNGFFWTARGFEYPAMWMLLCLAVVIRGGGRLSVDRVIGREF